MQSKIFQLQSGITSKKLVVCAVSCEVTYQGKAETSLAKCDRLIIIKPDGTILIHQPEGNNPINYMKSGTEYTIKWEPPNVVLNAVHIKNSEKLNIIMDQIYFLNSSNLTDAEKIKLSGNEKDMSNMIYANPSIVEHGLIPVNREEQTKYGFIDVLCTDKNNYLVVIECKRFKADLAAVSQLRRYVEKIKTSKGITSVRGILVAPAITSNAMAMLKDWGFNFILIEPPKFKEHIKKTQTKIDEY